MKKALLLVDVQNVYYTCRQAYKRNFNYNRFWRELSYNLDIEHAFAYAIDKGDSKQREFQNILRAIGFEVKLKPFIQRADGSAKGDWDVGITVDALEHASQVDEIILVSGDGDFDILVNALKEKGKTVTVYGVPALTAESIQKVASKYVPIDTALLL
ncbi:NYN domain-containing protein [Alteromonas mediterranea]|uniref:LabA-like NYN domain-containing protein n=1 Tax=Alteromonas mediterranea TaxID=314275 RepID=UPI00241C174D|nr:NYN domain-containing protein [Alteromonas mediterranea]